MSFSEAASDKIRLRIKAASDTTEIRVLDARFGPVSLPENVGETEIFLTQGIYEVGFRDGTSWQSKQVLLRSGGPEQAIVIEQDEEPLLSGLTLVGEPELELPPQAVPGPTSGAPEETLRADVTIIVRDLPERGSGDLSLPSPQASSPDQRFAGLSLLRGGEDEVAIPGAATESGDISSRLSYRIEPGYWRLRLDTGITGLVMEIGVVVCPGWHTRIYLPTKAYGTSGNRRADLSQAQIRLILPDGDPASEDRAVRRTEVNALQALADRRPLHGRALHQMLNRLLDSKFFNPMEGIFGAYLLPCSNPDEIQLLDTVAGNLAALTERGPLQNLPPLPGFRHPDVQALQLRLALLRKQPIERDMIFEFPPMLTAGWRVLLKGAERVPWLIPSASLTDRIAGRLKTPGPWVLWNKPNIPERSVGNALTLDEPSGTGPSGDGAMARRSAVRSAADPLSGTSEDIDEAAVMQACAIIDAGLHHRAIREWYRRASGFEGAGPVAEADAIGSVPEARLGEVERFVAGMIHPIASDEKFQPLMDQVGVSSRAAADRQWTAERLAAEVRLPLSTIQRVVLELAAKFLEQGLQHNLDLRARSPMARPEFIIPYDSDFLGDGFTVPRPRLTDALHAAAYADGAVWDYTHYSLVMHADRRVAIYTAHNVDASRTVRVSGRTPWKMDERVGEHQLGPEMYADNQLDRGHLVRRQDVLWGTVTEARLANKATFFYTNAAPQHQNFNQDEWLELENWVLEKATEFSYRLCVFTGPVLRSNDPVLTDLPPNLRTAFQMVGPAQIPAAFWKIIVLRDANAGGDDLACVAFAMRQSDMWNDKEGKRLLKLKVHQVTLAAIEEWTGLDFGDLKLVDDLVWSEERTRLRDAGEEAEWPLIRSQSDILFTGPQRRARGIRAARKSDASPVGGMRAEAASQDWAGQPARFARGLRSAAECGCGPADDFDAREAIAALNRDVARLTEMVGASSGAGTSGPTARGRSAGGNGASDDGGAAPAVAPAMAPDAETRIEAFASHAPSSMQNALRSFAREIVTQADIARGVAQAAAPTELKRIVGGDTVPPGGFSSCCCIGDATDWFCTGVLVAPQVVLTAAHCGRQITRVMVGGNQVKPFLSSDAIIVPVRQVIVHPDYRRSPLDQNDINVLILAKPAGVPPVAIASVDQLRQAQDVQLVGFGYNDPERPIGFGTKRQVSAPIGAIKLKDEDLSDLERFLGFHADYEFVAGRKTLGRDTCNGDSGGPAYIPSTNAFVVAGLTSRATREATVNCGDGGIYVRPDRFRDWIASVVAGAGLAPLP